MPVGDGHPVAQGQSPRPGGVARVCCCPGELCVCRRHRTAPSRPSTGAAGGRARPLARPLGHPGVPRSLCPACRGCTGPDTCPLKGSIALLCCSGRTPDLLAVLLSPHGAFPRLLVESRAPVCGGRGSGGRAWVPGSCWRSCCRHSSPCLIAHACSGPPHAPPAG